MSAVHCGRPRGAALPFSDDVARLFVKSGHPTWPPATLCGGGGMPPSGLDLHTYYQNKVWERSVGTFVVQIAELKALNDARRAQGC